MLVDIVRSSFFLQCSFKKMFSATLIHYKFNKCRSCKLGGVGGSAEKTQDCSANKHINYLLKHEGGGNKILASETQLPVSRRQKARRAKGKQHLEETLLQACMM